MCDKDKQEKEEAEKIVITGVELPEDIDLNELIASVSNETQTDAVRHKTLPKSIKGY